MRVLFRSADALARYVIIAIFELFEEGNAVLLLPAFGLDFVGRKLAPVIGGAAGDCGILAEPCREIHAALGRELFGGVVVGALGRDRHRGLLPIKGARRVDLDRCADGVGVHVRSQRLLDLDRFDQFRRNDVERDRAHVRFRGRHAAAVDGRRIEVRIEAAHGNEASLALIVQDIDARRTAKRLGDVLVGKLADRVAGQHRLHAISGTLPGNRATEARLLADDQDGGFLRSEEHTSELQSLMRSSYAVFCLKKKNKKTKPSYENTIKKNTSNDKKKTKIRQSIETNHITQNKDRAPTNKNRQSQQMIDKI